MANPLSVVVSNAVIPQTNQAQNTSQGIPDLQFSLSVATPQYLLAPPGAELAFAYWVLDRVSPASGPKWSSLSLDPNRVPEGIQPFMDDGHILVFSCLALSITSVPQGPLYSFLRNAGAGPVLEQIEALNTGFACGVHQLAFSYTLVSIPGTGMPGIEDWNYWVRFSWTNAVPVLTVDASPVYEYVPERRLFADLNPDEIKSSKRVVTSGLQTHNQERRILVFGLIPAADGRYMPVRVP